MSGNTVPGASVFRGGSLEEVLPKIKDELGPDAIIVCEREGVVGGIGGFFARRCVEVEAVPRALVGGSEPPAVVPTPAVPARIAANAYANGNGNGNGTALSLDELVASAFAGAETAPEPAFADLLARARTPAAPDPDPDAFMPLVHSPEPLAARIDVTDEDVASEPAALEDDEAAVRRALQHAGVPDAEADELVRHALIHARPFAPHAPLRDVVRDSLAEALQTPLGWKARRRVLVLAGTEGAGTAEVAAALCAGYARVGLSVGALGLDGVRAAVALATHTEDAAVAVGIAEDVEDVRRALPRLGQPDLLVAIAPTVVPGDEARLARTADLLAELPAHDLHLVLPSGATAGDATTAHATLAAAARVKGVLPVALDEAATIGGVVSLALRERLQIRWTASGAGAARVATADAAELAARALP